MRFPWMGRGVAMVGVVLALMWALSLVTDVVRERSARQQEAEDNVAEGLAGAQTLVGPWLVRDCVERYRSRQGEGRDAVWRDEQRVFTVQATPTQLTATANAGIEARQRGIFTVNGYVLEAQVEAVWSDLAALQANPSHEQGTVTCQAPRWLMSVSDPRGIRQAALTVEGRSVTVDAGTGLAAYRHGMSARLPAVTEADLGSSLRTTLRLTLVGTRHFAMAPIGQSNQVSLGADWPHPSFNGRFLPTTRTITAQRFDATWKVSALASTARDSVLAGKPLCGGPAGLPTGDREGGCVEQFGVAFMDPVNPYVLSDRATKYGLLFIVLTFVAVGLAEVLRRLRVHPVQYLLVGAALVVFFLLLVSLSEPWSFEWAYLTAASACTALLTFYARHVLGGLRAGALFGGGIAALYGVLYVLLRLEQNSLLMGALLLFVVLAAVMALTRRVDWYALAASRSAGPGPQA